jgi:ATP-dependent DNA ligase
MRGIPYEDQWVMFPPRAKTSIRPKEIERADKWKKWIAQLKYNGTRTLIFFLPDGSIEMWNRHQEKHKQYNMSGAMKRSLEGLKLGKGMFHVLDGELLHNKTKGIKHRIVLFDVLVYDSEYLVGTTYEKRYHLLDALCLKPQETEKDTGRGIALRVNECLWLAPVFGRGDFKKKYDELTDLDEIEGLVLKDPKGKLDFGVKQENNIDWQVRCRKEHKNYAY